MRSACRTGCLALPALALVVPSTAAAKPADAGAAATTVALRSVSAPPRQVLAGQSFTLTGRVRNVSSRATRPRVVVRIARTRSGAGRAIATKRLARVKAGRLAKYRVRVKLSRSLASGRYYLRACARVGGRRSCRDARFLNVVVQQQSAGGDRSASTVSHRDRFRVLAFTEARDETHSSTSEGVDALQDLGRKHDFSVSEARSSSGVFTESNLKRYRAVVFLNTAGDVLNAAEQTAFENYYKDGGGFLGVHSAIVTEPDWQFLTDLLGTRATGPAAALDSATIEVADRVHDASNSLPEYWEFSDEYYNFTSNVRGFSHVLATVDETTYAGGTMGFDHPVAWCKDYQGGRSFYTAVGHTRNGFKSENMRRHLAGAIEWTAGESDPVYSDCGATVLANYEQVKVTAPPNINEPIGFDQLPDGRLIQTTRDGRVRLHDPETGSSDVIAQIPVYAHSEDGLYGPAVDNNFATNQWVYLYYSPLRMDGVSEITGKPFPAETAPGNAPTSGPDIATFDSWMGYFQLSRFKFVDTAGNVAAHLDMDSEQKIMRVEVDRGACCHVAGDIDFDKHNNLWLVTGDDTPAGSVNVQQFPPFNDMKTNETQNLSAPAGSTGTFTLTFDGRTTGPIPLPFDNAAIEAALEALPNITDVAVSNAQGGARAVNFRGGLSQTDVPQMTASAPVTVTTALEGNWFLAPHNDARRSSTSTNDLRGKILRIKVNADGTYRIPRGNLFPEGMAKTRPEIYAMGFRNPFRIQVDSNDVAYVTDYSPDSRAPTNFRGPAGTGRVEIVRKPSNYGWPMCYAPNLPMYLWDFNTSTSFMEQFECDNRDAGPANASRWNTGLRHGPPITQPDIWYSYNDNAATPQGTPCLAYYDGSGGTCPQLFPELGTGGVGPHGAATYEFDPDNPSETKFPPYYDGAMILGEFTRDWLREVRIDSKGGIQKINNVLNCGAFGAPGGLFECDNPMDMQFGADGSFSLLTYGDGFFVANPDAGLYRFDYVAGPQRPRAVMNATPTNGVAPLTVQFSSEGSNDPDENDSISFLWDFGVPGTDADQSTDPNPSFTYTADGVYTARLTVTDSTGKSQSRTIQIVVGNTAPTVTVDVPVDGDFFEWGDSIPYTVTVTDPQDGPIDCNRVTVTFVLVHDQHGHGEAQQSGCSGALPTSADNAAHGGYIAGGINASYTDLGGAGGTPPLTTDAQHVVQLARQHVEYVQAASGIQFSGVAAPETDPLGGLQSANQLDPGDWLLLNNRYALDGVSELTVRFANNQAAGTLRGLLDVRVDAVDGPVVASCELRSTGGNGVYNSIPCPLAGGVTGSHRVYLTFRQATGGPAGGFGLINWVEFSGPGV
jgi:PKD repeat protein/type 1 glutamine amidotransferase